MVVLDSLVVGRINVLHKETFDHCVQDTQAEDSIHVLDETQVSILQGTLFDLMTTVEGDLLGVGDETRVRVAILALETRLFGDQLSERRRDPTQDLDREIDDETGEDGGLERRALAGLVLSEQHQLRSHEHDVEQRLGELRMEMGEIGAELGEILGETLIGVRESRVEILDAIVRVVRHVEIVEVMAHASAEGDRELVLEEADHAVDVGGGHREPEPLDDVPHKVPTALGDDRLDDGTIELRHLDAQERTRHQEARVQQQQQELLGRDARHRDAQQRDQLRQELSVHGSLALSTLCRGIVAVAAAATSRECRRCRGLVLLLLLLVGEIQAERNDRQRRHRDGRVLLASERRTKRR